MTSGGLTVQVLGSAGSFPQPGNPSSGYLVRTPTATIWIDCGAGTFAAIQAEVDLADIDAIIVSHQHADHCLELIHVHVSAMFVFNMGDIAVYSTAGVRGVIEPLLHGDLEPTFTWTTIDENSVLTIGEATVSFSRTDHPVETLAVRVEEDGAIFGYSADTGPGWSLAELDPAGAGFDLAICEATLNPEHVGRAAHLTAGQAGAMANASGVRSLALTHMYHWTIEDRLREAGEVFEGELSAAHPGTIFHLTGPGHGGHAE